jgi:hypothetical protein
VLGRKVIKAEAIKTRLQPLDTPAAFMRKPLARDPTMRKPIEVRSILAGERFGSRSFVLISGPIHRYRLP